MVRQSCKSFIKRKELKKTQRQLKMKCINLWIKNSFLLCLILLFILGCNNKKINIYENTEDSFPKLLIAINDSLFDNLNENGIRYQNYKDTVHFKDFLYPEKTIVFQKVNFEDFGFRSNKILISFERAEETNGINFSAEISNYDSLYIKYYDFKNRKNVLEINLNKEEKKMFKTLLSNLNHYNQEYREETYSPFSDEKLLVVFDINNTNEIISGNLKLMPKQLSALVIMIEVYIKRFSKESDNTTMKDLPSYQILEFYNKKTKIGDLPEPEPIP